MVGISTLFQSYEEIQAEKRVIVARRPTQKLLHSDCNVRVNVRVTKTLFPSTALCCTCLMFNNTLP